ncbi:2-phosphosulfolactate phosphatase [Catenuloplanes nepalensis]|uniref:Probable 2-phosphosulfolactate phosphatase n=1 Tax=Catenuloplanes nepalensis TaxID=587533 RepID=A0ABT9N3S0_9ACTN|nr:2-phosphosulfolactate phosphatase [Catenuloplanes nepalensis]
MAFESGTAVPTTAAKVSGTVSGEGDPADAVYAQPGAGVRFDWGLAGASELGRVCAALVVVDVLSFTTAVDVAVGRGTRVHPFPWSAQAEEYASRVGAVAAVGRTEVSRERPWSLSPAALRRAPSTPDLVLPSANGSAICAAASATGLPVVAGCLRNARAVARWLLHQGYGTAGAPIGVVAAGERWPDDTLRPGVEDLLGAASVLDGLAGAHGGLSVEAAVALAALNSVPDVAAAVRGSVSGRELAARGFAGDVEIAVERNASTVVPLLRRGVFGRA